MTKENGTIVEHTMFSDIPVTFVQFRLDHVGARPTFKFHLLTAETGTRRAIVRPCGKKLQILISYELANCCITEVPGDPLVWAYLTLY